MKLTYWMAECLDDSAVYNIRERTKREAKTKLASGYSASTFGPIRKVEIEYSDGFELVWLCLNESGAYWEC